MKKRNVICHYHIFKNSGTTFDELLKHNYAERHVSFDGPFPYFVIEQNQFESIIMRSSNTIAFSSHQIRLPVPTSLDFVALPVIFIRHPLLRARSIYKFKGKTDDNTPMSKIARSMSFDQWVIHCLSDAQLIRQISNAQTGFLSGVYQWKRQSRRTTNEMEFDIHQAMRNIENVPLLGRTEYFDNDIKRFPEILAQYDIEFKIPKVKPQNVTSPDLDKPLVDRLEQARSSLSEENYDKLMAANSQDLFLFEHVSKTIEKHVDK